VIVVLLYVNREMPSFETALRWVLVSEDRVRSS